MGVFTWRCGGGVWGALLLWSGTVPVVLAGDLTTLSGTTYHQARMLRVEPDGVVWEHATGQCKVDFTDLPEGKRKEYHYDAKKAAAYQAEQTQAQQAIAERTQVDQREAAARQARRLQAGSSFAGPDAKPDTFTYGRFSSNSGTVRSVSETIASKTAEQTRLTKDDGTFWDRRLWAVPMLIFGRSTVDTSAHPEVDPAIYEYRGSLHHTPGGFAPDSVHDNFYNPDYLTKAYYKDVERAEAFARGWP